MIEEGHSYTTKLETDKEAFADRHSEIRDAKSFFDTNVVFGMSLTENDKKLIYIFTYIATFISNGEPNAVWDHFERTPPMSTFTLGLVIADLKQLGEPFQYKDNGNDLGKKTI